MADECLKCGACCKFVLLPNPSGKDVEWFGYHGMEASARGVKIDVPCQMLGEDGKCSIYEQRPENCKEFVPGSIPECPLYKGEEKKMQDQECLQECSKDVQRLNIVHKQFAIEDCKVSSENGKVFIEGYANVKGKKDRYGDIPTVFSALRDYVYELKDFKRNPVCLLDHDNSVGSIVGSFNEKLGGYITEDDIGLKFKMVFSESDLPIVAHARKVYEEGHGKALSIGGRWNFENKDNPNYLTLAEIYEISLVGVGADPSALTTKSCPDCPKKCKGANSADAEKGAGKGPEMVVITEGRVSESVAGKVSII